MNKEDLLKSKTFCVMPWVHMHLWPNSTVYPCCMWDSKIPLGKFGENNSLMDIWNSSEMRNLRLNMLSNEQSEGCKRCYELESFGDNETLRKSSFDFLDDSFDLIKSTSLDGTLNELKMNYLDIRFNNLCNLKCQTCGHELSSTWHDDQKIIEENYDKPKVIKIDANEKLWDELVPLLADVKRAYFAGGEPLVCDEHYKILDLWLNKDMKSLSINYTTNFSLLNHKEFRVLDYWKQFNNVSVSASLDDSGSRAEYLRKETKWEVIEENRRKMIKECPDVYFEITPTISIYNAFHFPEFHWDWIERELIEPNDLRLNILTYQRFMNIRVFPNKSKELIKNKYIEYLDKIVNYSEKNNYKYDRVIAAYNSVIKFMYAENDHQLKNEFYNWVDQMDRIRNESLYSSHPELKELLSRD